MGEKTSERMKSRMGDLMPSETIEERELREKIYNTFLTILMLEKDDDIVIKTRDEKIVLRRIE